MENFTFRINLQSIGMHGDVCVVGQFIPLILTDLKAKEDTIGIMRMGGNYLIDADNVSANCICFSRSIMCC